jgi:hypothetical protein
MAKLAKERAVLSYAHDFMCVIHQKGKLIA